MEVCASSTAGGASFEPPHDLTDRERRGNAGHPHRVTGAAAAAKPLEWMGEAAATMVTGAPPGGGPPAANTGAMARPQDGRGESGVPLGGLHEHPTHARAAAGGQADIPAVKQARLMSARRQLPLGPGARHAAVGEQLIEARHHLLLGHHRQLSQLACLEPPGDDPG